MYQSQLRLWSLCMGCLYYSGLGVEESYPVVISHNKKKPLKIAEVDFFFSKTIHCDSYEPRVNESQNHWEKSKARARSRGLWVELSL